LTQPHANTCSALLCDTYYSFSPSPHLVYIPALIALHRSSSNTTRRTSTGHPDAAASPRLRPLVTSLYAKTTAQTTYPPTAPHPSRSPPPTVPAAPPATANASRLGARPSASQIVPPSHCAHRQSWTATTNPSSHARQASKTDRQTDRQTAPACETPNCPPDAHATSGASRTGSPVLHLPASPGQAWPVAESSHLHTTTTSVTSPFCR
jgi:hypothetical protein